MVWFLLLPLLSLNVFHTVECATYCYSLPIRMRSPFRRESSAITTTAGPKQHDGQRRVPWSRSDPNHNITESLSVLSLRAMVDRRTMMMMMISGFVTGFTTAAEASRAKDDVEDNDVVRIISGVKVPSEDQPQIQFPNNPTSRQTTTTAAIEGFLSLKYPRSERRPTTSDVILVTVQTIPTVNNHNDSQQQHTTTILAGARIPVARIRSFPVRFRLGESNVWDGVDASEWVHAMQTQDLLVRAVICSSNNNDADLVRNNPPDSKISSVLDACFSKDDSLSARGIAKLIRLSQQQQQENDGSEEAGDKDIIIIRAPVTLPLE